MGGLGRIAGTLVGVMLIVFSGTAVADDDDDEPGVVTLPASQTGPSSSLLRAYVDPNDQATTFRFEYGATSAYGSQTATASAGSGDDPVSVSVRVEGLQPSTVHHFRVVATNSKGTSHGSDRSFTTLAAGAPTPPPGGGPVGGGDPPPGDDDAVDRPKPNFGHSV